MTDEPDQSIYIPRRGRQRPWESLSIENTNPQTTEQINNARRHQHELDEHGSEFSHGAGLEPPWITARANRLHRYATPAEGGRYHGTTPPLPEAIIRSGRQRG